MYNQSFDLTAKSLELLHVGVPNAKRIAVLMSANVAHETMVNEAYAGASVLGLTIIPVMARIPADLDDAFATMHRENCDALVVLADARINRKIVEFADKWHLPAIYQHTAPAKVREVAAPRFEQSLMAHYRDAFNLAQWRCAMATPNDSRPVSALEERLLGLPDNAALKAWSKEKPRR